MKYLITGGAGFIGSHLADALLARRDAVVILDNFSTGDARNVAHMVGDPRVQIQSGSILDDHLVRRLVDHSDAVVHLAAAVGVDLIVSQPLESLITNIRGTETVLDACAEAGRKVLISSTSEIYGKNVDAPLCEDADRILGSPFKSRWSYSTAKAVDEILAYAYWRERGTHSIVIRLFNCVGPRQTGAYGMVVPRFVQQAITGEDVTVYGDGEQRRCFCHVRDAVAALLLLMDNPDTAGHVYNVGSQEEVTVNELAHLVVEMAGSTSAITHVPYDIAYEEGFEDMMRRVPDVSRIRDLTGWQPTLTLEQTLADVIAYERDGLASQ